ncbi:hypothetical protein JMN32_05835 [Fulvivirga sp. 29W222]|uniref:Uncharacterized protein n=1 Tax=Fulvivirga marina TaxID=2494733 RepID=A0A937KBA5_9BACT|nr:contractile injection system tape measure protein [Fulvivirga marina]MBL6445817.1 hypothetical protein [Fulvivirga marina]
MADNLHTIQKQSFEVDFPSEKKAYEFQERFSTLVKEQVSRTIEAVFDKVNPKNAVLRISRLEIDLGTVDLDNLEKDIVFRLERELLKALEKKSSIIREYPVKGEDELISTQRSLLEVFIFYLQSGTLPWWGRYIREHGVRIEQVFELLIQTDPLNSVREIIQELQIKSVRNRFIKQFKDELLLGFLEIVYPSKKSLLKDSFDTVSSVFNSIKERSTQVSRVPFREIFWQFIIETYVAIPPGMTVDMSERSFNEKLVAFFIDHNQINQSELRTAIFAISLSTQVKDTVLVKVLKQSLRRVEPARPEREKVEELDGQDVKEWISKWYEKVSKEQFIAFLQRALMSEGKFVAKFIDDAIKLFKKQQLVQSDTRLLKALYGFVVDFIYVEKRGRTESFERGEFLSFTAGKIADYLKVEPIQAVKVLSEEYEDVEEKPVKRTYTQHEVVRFFLLFGALPSSTTIRTLEELTGIITQMEASALRDIVIHLDPMILPLIVRRIRYQFEDSVAQKVFDAVPELRIAEIVDESFKLPLEATLARLSEEPGLYKQLLQLIEGEGGRTFPEEIQQVLTEAVDEAAVLDFIIKGKSPVSVSKKDSTPAAIGLDVQTRNKLIAGIYKLLEEKPNELFDVLKEAVEKEEILSLWVKHLPDDLLLRIAQVIVPVDIEERVKWVDLYIAREIKDKSYRVTQPELRQLEWKHILTSSTDEVRRLVFQQGDETEKGDAMRIEADEDSIKGTEKSSGKELFSESDGVESEQMGQKVKDEKKEVAEEAERKRKERERTESERKKNEQVEREKKEKEHVENDRMEKERVEREKEEERRMEREKKEKERIEKEKQERLERRLGREPIYINNAGLVLLHPFLSRLFGMLELLENKKFKDDAAAKKAVHILQYIAYKDDKSQEFELALNKVLCGLDIFEPLDNTYELDDKEKELCESLVNGVIQNWSTLGKTSSDNFRVSFLHREGRLEKDMNGSWQLHVEQKAWDVLMDTLPWSISMVILPWMEKTLSVEWR